MIVRTEEEVDALYDRLPGMGERSKYPGQTYEDGLKALIEWLTDETIVAEDIL